MAALYNLFFLTLITAVSTSDDETAIDAFKHARFTVPDHLIFFAFNLIVSSFTKIPFPLYGSGFLHIRIFAANCITTSFSIPSSSIRVGCGVLAFMPRGIPSSIGCEYPTFRETNCWPGYSGCTVVAVGSIVARYPTPTKRRMAVWPSDTPRM